MLWESFKTESDFCQSILIQGKMKDIKASIISIGSELLLGKTINTNMAFLGSELSSLGIIVHRNIVIQDVSIDIQAAIKDAWQESDVVICSGGLGPTKDDITKQAIADVFGTELVFDSIIWMSVQKRFAMRKIPTPEINRNQALVPKGFEALANDEGTAPGLFFQKSGKFFFALPGVPLELKHIYRKHIDTILRNNYRLSPICQRTIHTWDISESALAERLADIDPPHGIELAWLPQTGRVDLRVYGQDTLALNAFYNLICAKIADKIWGFDSQSPQSVLLELLIMHNLQLSIAESCTGGLVSKLITDVPGASKVLLGSLVAYSNDIKQLLLNVKEETLLSMGAVSAICAEEMAKGIKHLTKSKIGVSVTGVAGPDGGTIEKPVGTVFFGIAHDDDAISFGITFSGDRDGIRAKSAEYMILSLIKWIKDNF